MCGLKAPARTDVLLHMNAGSRVQAVSEEAYTAVVCQHVQQHLSRHTKRVFDSPVLPAAQAYVAAVPMEFLRLLLTQVLSLTSHVHS